MPRNREIYFQRSYIRVQWNDAIEAVEMHWHGSVEGENFREALDTGLELLGERGAENWFADLRELGTVSPADQEWSNEDWFPRAIAAGVENMAIVRPESVVADMSVETIMREVEGTDLVVRNFADPDEARDWLGRE